MGGALLELALEEAHVLLTGRDEALPGLRLGRAASVGLRRGVGEEATHGGGFLDLGGVRVEAGECGAQGLRGGRALGGGERAGSEVGAPLGKGRCALAGLGEQVVRGRELPEEALVLPLALASGGVPGGPGFEPGAPGHELGQAIL